MGKVILYSPHNRELILHQSQKIIYTSAICPVLVQILLPSAVLHKLSYSPVGGNGAPFSRARFSDRTQCSPHFCLLPQCQCHFKIQPCTDKKNHMRFQNKFSPVDENIPFQHGQGLQQNVQQVFMSFLYTNIFSNKEPLLI